MNGDVEEEAPRPRPLSAGIWTLFSWLRRSDRTSSSESVSSVGSDRTVASFDFLAPLNYKKTNTPLVLPLGPLTDTYKQRLQERNLRRQHDRDLTLRRKYGLFREEGLGYDAFSLPVARRLQKDKLDDRQDRGRRATSESTRRSAYVPGKRRAPLPPTVIVSATLPRTNKRKRPAPKPPSKLSEENKENVEINKTMQMDSTDEIKKQTCRTKDIISSSNKTEKHSKHETKEIKLRTDKSFLKQIFDGKKRNSAIDTSRIKYLPSISELDKQAAAIIEANKALQASGQNDSSFVGSDPRSTSTEETWICTACLRRYKPVVTCCIYCVIKESSIINKDIKSVPINASNICTQTEANAVASNREKIEKSNRIDDKKKLREMLKEMKDSLPKRPKHTDKFSGDGIVKPTETPTLRIGSTIDDNMKGSLSDTNNTRENERGSVVSKGAAKEKFLRSQPSSSRDFPIKCDTRNESHINRKLAFEPSTSNSSRNLSHCLPPQILVQSVEVSLDNSNKLLIHKNYETNSANKNSQNSDSLSVDVNETREMPKSYNLENIDKSGSSKPKYDVNVNGILSNLSNNVHGTPNHMCKDDKEICPLNSHPHLGNTTNFEKESGFTKENEKLKHSEISVTNIKLKTSDNSPSENKEKIERIQLGNVFSAKVVNINDTHRGITADTTRNMDLHTPLKISSLLNPLYSPKYKITSKVADCNLGKILITQDTNEEINKIKDSPKNQQKILPNITVSASLNVQSPSTSNTKLLHQAIQKSEDSSTGAPKVKCINLSEIVEDSPKTIVGENISTEAKTIPTSSVKMLDHHDRRRNLINQLEQAISKGDEKLAAEAAAKLAKLKLACSVLSFSSQIIAEAISNKTEVLKNNTENEENKTKYHVSASNIGVDSRDVLDKVQQENQKSRVSKKINISTEARASTSSQTLNDEIPIEVWVEDREAARGPIPMSISRKARMGELKRQVESSLGLAIRLQRWIIGRSLCTDDNTPLNVLAGPDLNAPFYLCLVESETNKDNAPLIKDAQIKTELDQINNAASGDVYTELMKLEQQALVPNTDQFECGVCIEQCAVGDGVVLRECIHTFCRECLVDVIRHCEEPVVACPAIQCPGTLQEREIRAILSTEEYERWLARGLAAAESGTRNTFHCRTRDCKGWAFCEPGVRRFPCPVCKHTNCVPCQAVHEDETCEQYQMKLRDAVSAAESNQTDQGTQALLKSLISRGEALECPECSAIITKKWGCDWIKCSACKTEICWVTRGRRWGPGGKGDTSGGCRCGVDGKRCHPSCGYCH